MTFLTIFAVCPYELDGSYLALYREALLRWNKEGLADTQVILLPQRRLEPDEAEPFEVVDAGYEVVGGYPVWDIMRAVRKAWPLVRGKYVSFDHPEFIWGPGRLDQTISWLSGCRPIYAMGNLRRPGTVEDLSGDRNARDTIGRKPSDWFKGFLDRGRWDDAAEAFEHVATTHWMYWAEQQRPGPVPWVEDAFYVDKSWLDAWGFATYDLEMPFQDVYDLMQVTARTMAQYGVPVFCQRMPQSVNRVLHLWHPRTWASFSPKMRDWFLGQPDRWRRSSLGDAKQWADIIAFAQSPLKSDYRAVTMLRFGPRGTAISYGCALAAWLNCSGVEAMRDYYTQRREAALR